MDFSFEPKVTKDFLLSKNNEETYLAYYLEMPLKKGLFRSPLRKDSHVTCSLFRGKSGRLYFKDFATGECLTFEGVVMAKYGCNYHEALNIIAKDFGLIKGNSNYKPIIKQESFKIDKQTFIQVQIKDFSNAELKWWNSFGISQKTLSKYNVFSCDTVFLNGSIYAQSNQHTPIFGYYFGKKENIEQWRIYMPTRKEMRFIGNVSTKTIQGYKQIPKNGKVLIITKSMKDSMLFYELGIPAIAPNSETQKVSNTLLDDLKQRFKYIIYMYDNDLPGITNLNKIRKEYPDLYYYWIPRGTGAKDISDYYKMYGKEKTKSFILSELDKIKTNKRTKFII
jgi:hypothetical protein